MSNFNDDLPSSADSLVAKHQPDGRNEGADGAIKAVAHVAAAIPDRTRRAARSGGRALAQLSPGQAALVAAAAGFAAGWWFRSQEFLNDR